MSKLPNVAESLPAQPELNPRAAVTSDSQPRPQIPSHTDQELPRRLTTAMCTQ